MDGWMDGWIGQVSARERRSRQPEPMERCAVGTELRYLPYQAKSFSQLDTYLPKARYNYRLGLTYCS